MKKVLLLCLALLAVLLWSPTRLHAQASAETEASPKASPASFKPSFGITAGLGAATTIRYSFNRFDANGLVVSLAPSYMLSPRLSLSLQGEYVLINRFLSGTESNRQRVTAPAIQAFSLAGTYYLAKAGRPIQPFIGVGLGLYNLGTGTLAATNTQVALGTRRGLSVRAGLQRGRMGVGIEAVLLDEGSVVFNRDYLSAKYFYTFR